MENAKKFFEEIIKTDEAKAVIAATKTPETDEGRIAAYLDIAKKLNAELTVEDLIAYFNAENSVIEVDDEELAQLVGGAETCSNTYLSGENCWFTDGCDIVIHYYQGYQCGTNAFDAPTNHRDELRRKRLMVTCGSLSVTTSM